jgi:hypothetical protein
MRTIAHANGLWCPIPPSSDVLSSTRKHASQTGLNSADVMARRARRRLAIADADGEISRR